MRTVARTLLATLLLLSACSEPTHEDHAPPGGSAGARVVEVTASDDLRFSPASIAVEAGETVRFVVENTGELHHELLVGTKEAHDAAPPSDATGDHQDHGPGLEGAHVHPGATGEVEITFDEAGELLYACHIDGHYEAGMVGTLTVE